MYASVRIAEYFWSVSELPATDAVVLRVPPLFISVARSKIRLIRSTEWVILQVFISYFLIEFILELLKGLVKRQVDKVILHYLVCQVFPSPCCLSTYKYVYDEGKGYFVQWGSVTHQMAVPVPSIHCCVLNHHDCFTKYRMHYLLTRIHAAI